MHPRRAKPRGGFVLEATMAEIVLIVDVRERTGTGGARSVRGQDKAPGILYGGALGPVPIAVNTNEFRKALYTGKLLGHLVTLKYGDESQPVIAKDVQFDPVSDKPLHFALLRLAGHQARRHAQRRAPRAGNLGARRSHS